jgi:hypothetical protein
MAYRTAHCDMERGRGHNDATCTTLTFTFLVNRPRRTPYCGQKTREALRKASCCQASPTRPISGGMLHYAIGDSNS